MEFERRRRTHTHIDIAPLVDVVFLLLLFFMLSFHMTPPTIRVDLPESSTAEAVVEDVPALAVTAAGEVYLGKEQVPLEGLADTLRELGLVEPTKTLRIVADKDVRLEVLVDVVDQVKLAGFTAFDVVTRK